MTLRRRIGRRRLIAPITCCLMATMFVFSAARAEEGIPAGSGAVITAGAPLAVRSTPGWDAAVSYEIADGSYVTVWDVAQAAPDGSLWYPVDGGFVPVEAVSSVATQDSATLYQETAQDTAPDESVEPATPGAVGADLTAADPESAAAPTNESVEPTTIDTAADTGSKELLADSAGSVDPVQDESTGSGAVDPASAAATDGTTSGEEADLATDSTVVPVPVDAAPSDPAASTEPAPVSTSSTEGTEPWGEPIATAYIANTEGNGAPCLAAPDWGTETLAVLGEGEPVEVRAETMGEWQPVNCGGAGGYVQTAQIAWTPLEQVDRGAAPEADNDGGRRDRKADDGGGSAGNNIVDFAMKFEGHPYVYAGEGPRAFDCSGFTMFVIQKTLGLDITHDMAVQYEMGSHVGRNELQPGDLVFFKNTYRRGLSHTGIYIGGGQFIHAENESTGVRVSDLDSDYYSSRWYGAARFA